jgi:hypothetical protein
MDNWYTPERKATCKKRRDWVTVVLLTIAFGASVAALAFIIAAVTNTGHQIEEQGIKSVVQGLWCGKQGCKDPR